MDPRETTPASLPLPTSPPPLLPQKPTHQVRQVYLLLMSIIPEAILESALVPLYVFMVKAQSGDQSEDGVGYRAGLLPSAFYGPLFLMNMVWGSASDKIGRKPILVAGLVVGFACALTLGFSTTYVLTFMCRFVAGLFGANSTVAKGMLGEIFNDDTGRAWGYAMYGSVYGMSGIVGPFLAGILANPSKQYPSTFGGFQFWEKHPYSLPCFLGAALMLGGLYTTIYRLEESERAEVTEEEGAYMAVGEDDEELADWSSSSIGSLPSRHTNPPTGMLSPPVSTKWPLRRLRAFERFAALGPRTWFVISLYCSIALVNIMYMTALPFYLSANASNGGLNLDEKSVSMSVMVIALLKLAVQLFRFDVTIAYLGIINCFKFGMTLMIPTHLMVPFLSLGMPAHGATDDVSLPSILPIIPLMALLGIAECMAYTSVIIMITQSAPASQMGLAHGVAGTCAAVMRTIGPALAGMLWEGGAKAQFPGLVFVFGSAFSALTVVAVIWGRDRYLIPADDGEDDALQ
ncbi:hypothetical protein HDV00_000118 [Rhizophlyctis rosea]|nr:hypothetical protein HDV00_000118 [Rhizophlyctis rosea]